MSIVLERLAKRFGSNRVVDDVSLEIAEGELFVLLGASGSGKSTILRLIAGLARPDAGRILLHGRDVTHLPAQRRGTGFVFQNYSIFRHMTVSENVEFGLRIRKAPRAQRVARRDELLETVGLAGLGSRRAGQLSGGQQQRVAIARALAYEPSVLLLDEPFGALDVKIRQQLRRSLRQIQRSLGITMILVTHDQDEAFELADRVGLIERGRLVEVGAASELYARPRTLFTATFLGPGTVVIGRAQDGAVRLGPLALPIPSDTPHEEDSPVQVLFRPEEVALSDAPPDEGAHVLGKGEVVGQTFAGTLRRVRVRVELPATRQVSPQMSEHAAVVEAVQPGALPAPPGEAWVSLRSWRILEPPAPSLLVCDRGSGPRMPLALGRELANRLSASVTVLVVGPDAEEAEALAPRIRTRMRREGLAAAELRVRFGDGATQIAREQAESLHELITLSMPRRLLRWGPRRVGSTVQGVLERVSVPVLVSAGRDAVLTRILIATVSGAAETSHVRIAGRLARRLGLTATLLRATRPGEADAAVSDALDRDRATLGTLGVACDPMRRAADRPAEAILAAAEHGDHDVIAIGMPPPGRPASGAGETVVLDLLAETGCPVLVIPSEVVEERPGGLPLGASGSVRR